MNDVAVSGTQGYAEEADNLVIQYESISFEDVHGGSLQCFPSPPANLLDIGAGTGRDAAGFAALGYRVTAVEPTAELRNHAMKLHPSSDIEWIDDGLPDLEHISQRNERYHVVMLTAVWMHLDEGQRRRAMPRVCALIHPGGSMMLSLRHGPVPVGRRMFEVTAEETISLASESGMVCVQRLEGDNALLGRPGVTWDHLTFRKEQPSG
ncbi:class I SAM-dependent methyltransferase [Methylobacterium sp. 1030]|uniref:class I SAM-dependent methyltransferase n=1 Tax=Methylobacterium sp. 1030 TaxID=3156404 RepID=UPI003397C289